LEGQVCDFTEVDPSCGYEWNKEDNQGKQGVGGHRGPRRGLMPMEE